MLQDHYLTDTDTKLLEDTNNIDNEKGIRQCDIGYLLSFDPKDYDKLQNFFKHVRVARQKKDFSLKNELVTYYEQFLSRKFQDKTVSYELIPEPLTVGNKFDRVVFSGLERIADLATGKSDLHFNFYSIGTGTAPVLPADEWLDFEEARVAIIDTGFAESKGSSMVFAATFPSTLPSMSVTESGIFDRYTSPSTMLLRTVYTGSNIVSHISNQTFVAVSHFVYQLSV